MPDGTLSDGCSGWPNGGWVDCCDEHDRAYRCGSSSFLERRKADLNLMRCVMKKGYPRMGVLMFFGVRAFGWMPWHRNYRRWVGQQAQQIAKGER